MQFYDATNKRALCQEVDRLCDTTDASYSRLDKTARINDALEEIVGKIIVQDGTWQFDDTNYTTNPVGTSTLTEGQSKYSFATKFLDIESVDVKDAGGLWRRVLPIDPTELLDMTPEEYFGVNSGKTDIVTGMPRCYDKSGDGIQLFPAPTSTAVTLTNGLRIRFKRTADLFTATSATTADTKEPGFPSPYHPILAYMAALPYCMTYKKDRVENYRRTIGSDDPRSPYHGGMMKDLMAYFGRRERDARKQITMRPPKPFI